MCELACQIVEKKQEEKRIEEEQAANARYWKIPACYDDDDDDDSAITPILSTKEPIESLSMGDEHFDTISATESDGVIKSSVEDFIPIPSEFEASEISWDCHGEGWWGRDKRPKGECLVVAEVAEGVG
uniref:Uncharacterized protein n=1 Tax=Tanacetum cinerariifolium TaxID=118510 RepID=A0A6L2JIX7_TANCI|nr:hypothetical protein [Tanacetum cinerariifolium]